jgi:hypothetical protein
MPGEEPRRNCGVRPGYRKRSSATSRRPRHRDRTHPVQILWFVPAAVSSAEPATDSRHCSHHDCKLERRPVNHRHRIADWKGQTPWRESERASMFLRQRMKANHRARSRFSKRRQRETFVFSRLVERSADDRQPRLPRSNFDRFSRSQRALLGSLYRDPVSEQLSQMNERCVHGPWAGEKQSFERTVPRTDGSLWHASINDS